MEVGKLTDLVVLDKDYMTVAEYDIFYLKSLMTMVGGKIVLDELPEVLEGINRQRTDGLDGMGGSPQKSR